MKHKKLLIAVIVVVLVLVAAAIGNYWDRSKPSPGPSATPTPPATEPTPPATPDADALFNDADTKAEILASVESLIPDEYRGAAYSCDVLVYDDEKGPRYVVSIQIDVDVDGSDCSEVISSLEDAINGLGDTRISSVEIIAFKEMQMVGNNLGV